MPTIEKVLVFTGAGASVPLGLPASTGFIDDVKSGMRPITNQVMGYLGKAYSDDIEWILSTLETLREIGWHSNYV